jgi:very-short-patch-repair endonuclease
MSKGIEVLRFNASEVVREIDLLTQRIYEIVNKRLRDWKSPRPPFQRGSILGP